MFHVTALYVKHMHQMIDCRMLLLTTMEQMKAPPWPGVAGACFTGGWCVPRLITAILNHVAHYTLMEGDARDLEMRWAEREPFQLVHQDEAVKQEFKWFESRVS